MRLFIEKVIRKIFSGYLYPYSKISYSQNGEDLIIRDLFHKLGIHKPSYLDVGANEPFSISNTYLLYTKGCSGVCVEPNPLLYKKFRSRRPHDKCINAGIAFNEQREAEFFQFAKEASGLGTFSKEEASFWENTGNALIGKHKVQAVIKMPLLDINQLMEDNFTPHPNFLSLDVEGLDLAILKTIDFKKFRPEVICVETLGYEANDKEVRNQGIIAFLVSQGYFVYADTYINSIFCREDAYTARH